MPVPHQHHRCSLTELISRSNSLLLTQDEVEKARFLFNQLMNYASSRIAKDRYKPDELILQTFNHVKSTDEFLRYFLLCIQSHVVPEAEDGIDSDFHQVLACLEEFPQWDPERRHEVVASIEQFADYLIDNFFLPLRASSVKTPQPTPASHLSNQMTPIGTRSRVSRLRHECLYRDHHRCVVSRLFDRNELERRLDSDEASTDDDGKPLKDLRSDESEYLEVAHIIPHSLTSLSPDQSELSETKKAAHYILAMFDPDAVHFIEGQDIDSPQNALTLTQKYHRLFGEFKIYFEPTDIKYQFQIDSMEQRPSLRDTLFPVIRQLHLSPEHTIDPPSLQLLMVHRAVARILRLSGAGAYIEKLLQEMEDPHIKNDGSTNIGRFLQWGLEGWLKLTSTGLVAN